MGREKKKKKKKKMMMMMMMMMMMIRRRRRRGTNDSPFPHHTLRTHDTGQHCDQPVRLQGADAG